MSAVIAIVISGWRECTKMWGIENNISVHCKELYSSIYGMVLILKVMNSVSLLKHSYMCAQTEE